MEQKKSKTSSKSKEQYFQAVGRRRESNAQVRLYPVSGRKVVHLYGRSYKVGDFVVNKKDVSVYFPGEIDKVYYRNPFKVTKTLNDYFVSVVVRGGGKKGQLGATIHGIARALEKIDKESYRPLLKKEGLLTRDPRVKERRKAGLAQKARAKKSSPKR